MELEARVKIGEILISEFERLSKELDPHDEELPRIIKRAWIAKLKMRMFYDTTERSPELLSLINKLDEVIKKVEELHNKRCY